MDFGKIPHRTTDWTTFKALALSKGLSIQYVEENGTYVIYGYDHPEVISCVIWLSSLPASVTGSYPQAQNDADRADFEATYKPSANKQVKTGVTLSERQANALLVAPVGRMGSEVIYSTHSFSDKTTWYSESIRVTDEVLVDSGNGLTFNSAEPIWVDMTHGKVMDEGPVALEMAPSHQYAVVVTVNDVPVTQRAPYALAGGDYDVNYATGQVTFFSSQSGSTVKATYSAVRGSTWIMRPTPGKLIKIESAEAQFSLDADMRDTINFGAFGWVDVFAPHLTPTPYPSLTKIPLTNTRYTRFDQIIDEAMGSFPVIPAMGGATRGNSQPRYGFPFRYGSVRTLTSAAGMELRVWLDNDLPFLGERITATFYGSSEDA